MFNQILSREVTKFPFPKEVKTLKQKRDFIKKRDIQQQFDGFYNLLLKDISKRSYLFNVEGIEAPSGFSFKYNTVRFYSGDSNRYETLKTRLDKHLDSDFFNNPYTLIAEVPVEFFSSKIGKQQALKKIKRAVQYIEVVLNKNLQIQTNNFLVTHKFKDYQRFFTNENRPIKDLANKLNDLNDNPFYIFRNNRIIGADQVTKHEHLFIKAAQTGTVEDYWHYIEVLLSGINDEKHVQKIVSSIVLLGQKDFHNNFLYDTLFYSLHLFNTPSEKLGLTVKDHQQILLSLQKKKLVKEITQINYPFIKQIVTEIANSNQDLQKEKKYIENILKEAYEARNFFIHKGIQNEKSLIKLEESLRFLIMRFRWVIFRQLKLNKDLKFNELINTLVEKSDRMLDNLHSN